jgi:hypothetical protein
MFRYGGLYPLGKAVLKEQFTRDDKPAKKQATPPALSLFEQTKDSEIFSSLLTQHVALLSTASDTIDKLTRMLTTSSEEKLEDPYFDFIKKAFAKLEKNPQAIDAIKADIQTVAGLPDAYIEFNQGLNELMMLQAFFTQDPKCKNSSFLNAYKIHQQEFNKFKNKIHEILNTGRKYHGFVRKIIEDGDNKPAAAARLTL